MNILIKLCDLKAREVARVNEILPECSIKERLFDVGLIPGTRVECIYNSPLGGMKAYRVRGAIIAIRDEDCRSVNVYPEVNYGTD